MVELLSLVRLYRLFVAIIVVFVSLAAAVELPTFSLLLVLPSFALSLAAPSLVAPSSLLDSQASCFIALGPFSALQHQFQLSWLPFYLQLLASWLISSIQISMGLQHSHLGKS